MILSRSQHLDSENSSLQIGHSFTFCLQVLHMLWPFWHIGMGGVIYSTHTGHLSSSVTSRQVKSISPLPEVLMLTLKIKQNVTTTANTNLQGPYFIRQLVCHILPLLRRACVQWSPDGNVTFLKHIAHCKNFVSLLNVWRHENESRSWYMAAYFVNSGIGVGEPTAWRGCSSLWGAWPVT